MTDAPDGGTAAGHPATDPAAKKKSRGRLKREDIEARAQALEDEFKQQVAATRAQIDATNVKIVERTGRNLPMAILIGVGLGVILILSLVFIKALFMIFTGALIAFTTFELASALRFAGRQVPRWPTLAAGIVMVPAAFYLGDQGRWLVALGGMIFVALWRAAETIPAKRRVSARELWTDIAASTFVLAYVPFLGTFAVLLAAQDGGEWWTLAFLLVVVSVDVGAYATGLTLGKHPMAPRISPKKTWEGAAGSLAAALVAGVLLSIFMLHEPWWFGLIFGAVLALTATLGDLTESLIKRDLGIKDISTWLPGHGGFLDRLDSILPSAAIAYVLFLIFA